MSKSNKVKIDLIAYTRRGLKLETSVSVLFSVDNEKMKKDAINLGEKFWYSYDKDLISHIVVDFIHI